MFRFFDKISFKQRVFFVLIFFVLLSYVSTVITAFWYIRKVSQERQNYIIEDKRHIVSKSIDDIIIDFSGNLNSENVSALLGDDLYSLAQINHVELNLYHLNGSLLVRSNPIISNYNTAEKALSKDLLQKIKTSNKYIIKEHLINNGRWSKINIYQYVRNLEGLSIAVLNFSFTFNKQAYLNEFYALLTSSAAIFMALFLLNTTLAYGISKSITKRLSWLSQKIASTQPSQKNKPINYRFEDEITPLVTAYNHMVIQIDKTTKLLNQKARKEAWEQMAQQVAHEIKNSLTPMRLGVQHFLLRADNHKTKDFQEKTKALCQSLLQQIDTLSEIANSFALFSEMPDMQKNTIHLATFIRTSLSIYNYHYLISDIAYEEAYIRVDPNQLNRILTNIIKNSVQALNEDRNPKLIVKISKEGKMACITISDNGIGIKPENMERIFEPQFSTKNNGMGLGLAMVKRLVEDNNGQIVVHSTWGVGTQFKLYFYTENKDL